MTGVRKGKHDYFLAGSIIGLIFLTVLVFLNIWPPFHKVVSKTHLRGYHRARPRPRWGKERHLPQGQNMRGAHTKKNLSNHDAYHFNTWKKKKKGINSLTKWIWWFHRQITRLKELEWRVGSAWGWGRAPHFIVIFEDSAKILKELLSAAAGIISFIWIRALNACLNHKILLRNGNTVPRNSRTLQRQHMLKLEAVFFFFC